MQKTLHNALGEDPALLNHHAYLFGGDTRLLHGEIKTLLHETWNIPRSNPPLVFEHIHTTFGIDEGRALQHQVGRKGFGDQQFFIVVAETLTREAQNALLKLFEEPPVSALFFVIVPNAELLLPTLRSRFQHVQLDTSKHILDEASLFMESTIAERLEQVSDMLKEKDMQKARVLVGALMQYVRSESYSKEMQEYIMQGEQYLYGPSPSLKLIIEGLIYTLPQSSKK